MSLSIATGPATGPATVAAAAATSALCALLLWRCRKALHETTLRAPWSWALLAVSAVGGVEIVAGLLDRDTPPGWLASMRYTAAITTLAPVVALLGAKRPQDAAWKFIVLALLAVLALPAATALLVPRGAGVETQATYQWFTAALIAIGPLNYLPTRFALAAAFLALAQIWLLAEHLPGGQALCGAHLPLVGLAMLAAAIAAARLSRPRGARGANDRSRLWVDFRTMYGLLWSLRVAERVNVRARLQGWSVRLTWRGLAALDGHRMSKDEPARDEVTEEDSQAAHAALRALLARFVSPEWIAERGEDDASDVE